MIKPLEEIPQTLQEKRESYRAMIRADIQSAIDSGVRKFEFVGDAYNYKYLANYAREEADNITRMVLRPLFRAAAKERGLTAPPSGWWRCREYIKITRHKAADRMHVYCEINPDALPAFVEKELTKQIEIEKRVAARRAEREGKA